MTFPVNISIPLASHKPVNDVGPMRTNFSNLVSTWAVDHYDPNVQPAGSSSGTHKQVTYPINNVPAAPLGDIMIDYTNTGTANASAPQRFTRNSQGIFPMSAVRAFGMYQPSNGVVTFIGSQQFNCASISVVAAGNARTATIALNANAVNTDNALVFIQGNGQTGVTSYTFSNPTLTIVSNATFGDTIISFLVIQV